MYTFPEMIITVEGNIGAGKTAFTESLYDRLKESGLRVVYVPEPVDSYRNVGGTNLLELLYSDRQRWSFIFQVNALLQMTECDKQALAHSDNGFTVIRERSSYSVRNIFVPLVSEFLTAAERHVLGELCKSICSPLVDGVNRRLRTSDVTIYLDTDPDTCYGRLLKRGRPEEIQGRVDLKYLEKLHDLHERTFSQPFDAGRLIIAEGNTFHVSDPASVKISGSNEYVLSAIGGLRVSSKSEL